MPGTRWGRRLADGATEHLGYKAVAFLLAVALWVAASGEEPASRYVSVRFVPALDSGVTLVGDPPLVRALVEGPASEILKLYATPPAIHRALGRESGDAVHLDLRTADVDLPAGVARVSVRDVRPQAITLRLRVRRAAAPHSVPNDTFALTPVAPVPVPAPAAPGPAPASSVPPRPADTLLRP